MLRNTQFTKRSPGPEQDADDVFGVRGVCRRAGVRLRTRQCTCLCTLLADLEARPRNTPLAVEKAARSILNGIADPPPPRARPNPAVYGAIPVSAALRYVAEE